LGGKREREKKNNVKGIEKKIKKYQLESWLRAWWKSNVIMAK
jgi:hypothetical protein